MVNSAANSSWRFEGPNPIVSFTVGIEISNPLQPAIMTEIAALHAKFKPELPRKVEQPMLTFQIGGRAGAPAQPQLGLVAFDSVKEDGTIARALAINQTQINYMTANYARWEEFQPLSERLMREVTKVAIRGAQVTAVILGASNRFTWHGALMEGSLETLLRKSTKYVAPHVLKLKEQCHSFHGYVEKMLVGGRPALGVHNINVQTGDNDTGLRLADINLSHKVTFKQPVDDFVDLFSADKRGGHFNAVCSDLHDTNNKFFSELISADILREIPGMSS